MKRVYSSAFFIFAMFHPFSFIYLAYVICLREIFIAQKGFTNIQIYKWPEAVKFVGRAFTGMLKSEIDILSDICSEVFTLC